MITSLSDALAERGFDTLTPVQEAVIAPDLAESDLLVSAQTGSGKTVGFGLAIAPTLLGDETQFGPAATPLALIVAPTRELAFQVKLELAWLYARTGAVVASCVGGMDMRQERRTLERGAHIVVGTPGRLRDHIERGSLALGSLRAVVLDEADEMLDLGFREDLEFILAAAPNDRRTLLFSATVPPMIAALAQEFQRNAKRISTLFGAEQHADIAYQAIRVAASDNESAIFNLLRFHHDKGALVFANTRAEVNHLTARLANRGFPTVSLSGELSQSERTHALQAMRDGRARVCVATDVAARGIDLPNLALVIHADLPKNIESLLHRSGRTGRAGRKGISVLIVPPKSVKRAERLLKLAKISAEWTFAPSAEDILRQDEERLLSDPVWDEAPSDEEADFASKLLARQSPEQIAAAYLRLFQSQHSAPEDLLPLDAKAAARPPRDFGASRWIALSVGRKDRAEPRWILPLLCRAGELDKTDIGAIRVQETETYVELTESSLDGFMTRIEVKGALEEGIAVRRLDSAPDLTSARGPKSAARKPRTPRPQDRDNNRREDKSARKAGNDFAHKDKAKQQGDRPAAAKSRVADEPKPAPEPGREKGQGKPWRDKHKAHGGPAKKSPGKRAPNPKGKPKDKVTAPAANARDVSKRFSPKDSRKGSPTPRSGGNEPPRRKKS